jgi:succinoglycan biosynthesis protein ExoA
MLKSERLTTKEYPTVSIAIPAYNESAYIERVIKKFWATSYPNLVEILIADGGSTDETLDIVKNLSLLDSRVKLIFNPEKIQSTALNIMLSHAKGDIFLRADAHCDYASDYVERCVEALLESKALNVGGAQRFVATNAFQAGVALASRSFLGNGGAKYRDPNYNGYADTVFIGCFWRKALLELAKQDDSQVNLNKILAVFDPSQVTNQDAELNLKLLEKQPNAIYISSKIKVEYYPRKNIKGLWNQYFKYGRGRYLTYTKHPKNTPTRSKLPLMAIPLILFLFCADSFFYNENLHVREIAIALILMPFIEATRVTLNFHSNFISEFWRGQPNQVPNFLNKTLWCGIVLIILPIAYFSGNIYQISRAKILKIKGW